MLSTSKPQISLCPIYKFHGTTPLPPKDDSKDIIKITFASGPEKPYYIKKHGMSEKGCFIRIGSASEPMMRVFKDLDIVEYLGSGMPRILRAYTKDAFIFTANFVRASFPIDTVALELENSGKTPVEIAGKTPEQITRLLQEKPTLTLTEVAMTLGKSLSAL